VIAVSVVIDEARGILIDAAKITWSDATLIGFLNEFGRTTELVKHDFYTVREAIDLIAGTDQELFETQAGLTPVALLDVNRNTASKQIVSQCDKALLDECNRFWPADSQVLDVENFAVNAKEPTRFYVTPPNNGYGQVQGVIGCVPPEVTDLTDDWPVSEQYQAAAVNFVLARAYAQNTKRQDLGKTDYYDKKWGQLVGLKSQTQIANTPKTADPPETR
jgi:hypothetical protein